jgi:hypothetical protein
MDPKDDVMSPLREFASQQQQVRRLSNDHLLPLPVACVAGWQKCHPTFFLRERE